MLKKTFDLSSFRAGQEFQRSEYKRELHDGLAQELLGLQMLMRSFKVKLLDSPHQTSFGKIGSQLQRAVDCLDGIIGGFIPENLDGSKLEVAIFEMFEFEESDVLIIDGESGIIIGKDEFGIGLLRIIQEFISNSLKHGKATRISLLFEHTETSYTIKIIDDGIGFDVNSVERGSGLNNIVFRLEAMNAVYQYKSLPNIGTKLKITIHENATKEFNN